MNKVLTFLQNNEQYYKIYMILVKFTSFKFNLFNLNLFIMNGFFMNIHGCRGNKKKCNKNILTVKHLLRLSAMTNLKLSFL